MSNIPVADFTPPLAPPLAPPLDSNSCSSSSLSCNNSSIYEYHLPVIDLVNIKYSRNIYAANDNLSWKRILTWKKSTSGSLGVYYIQTCKYSLIYCETNHINPWSHSEIAVLKFVDNLHQFELLDLANEFSRRIGSNVCDMRLIHEKEKQEILEGIKLFYDKQMLQAQSSKEKQAIKEYYLLQCSFKKDVESRRILFLMSYLPGVTLENLLNYQRIITKSDFNEIGNLFCFDCFIANTDRFPTDLLFFRPSRRLKEQGNPGNLLFSKPSQSVNSEEKMSDTNNHDDDDDQFSDTEIEDIPPQVYSIDTEPHLFTYDKDTLTIHCQRTEELLKELTPRSDYSIPTTCNRKLFTQINMDIPLCTFIPFETEMTNNCTTQSPHKLQTFSLSISSKSRNQVYLPPVPVTLEESSIQVINSFNLNQKYYFFSEDLRQRWVHITTNTSEEKSNSTANPNIPLPAPQYLELQFSIKALAEGSKVKMNYMDETKQTKTVEYNRGEYETKIIQFPVNTGEWKVIHFQCTLANFDSILDYYYIYCPYPSLFKLTAYLSVSSLYTLNYPATIRVLREGFLRGLFSLSLFARNSSLLLQEHNEDNENKTNSKTAENKKKHIIEMRRKAFEEGEIPIKLDRMLKLYEIYQNKIREQYNSSREIFNNNNGISSTTTTTNNNNNSDILQVSPVSSRSPVTNPYDHFLEIKHTKFQQSLLNNRKKSIPFHTLAIPSSINNNDINTCISPLPDFSPPPNVCCICNAKYDSSTYQSHLDIHASEIIPNFLYLGGERNANNYTELAERLHCTHIINSAIEVQNFFSDKFHYINFTIHDETNENLIIHLPEAIEFIESAKDKNGKVFIHCVYLITQQQASCMQTQPMMVQGISRSSSIVIGYLMHHYNIGFQQAYDYVKKRRAIIQPNEGFKKQLKQLIIKAHITGNTIN